MKWRTTLYLGAWIAYIAFSFLLFPTLKITVMLVSIPLTMLGGWLYRYPGAIATVLLTIPYHYFMLSHHTSDVATVHEAFNPFGIGTQLCFSCATALLKTNRIRLETLNASLERLVDDRTRELRQLANHLIDADRIEREGVVAHLLDRPKRHLDTVCETGAMLSEQLKSIRHPATQKAVEIAKAANLCLATLHHLEAQCATITSSASTAEQAIRQMAHAIGRLSNVNCRVLDGLWNKIDPGSHHHLCHIVQEAVSNALRHAAPSWIDIGITHSPESVVVYIASDGNCVSATASGEGIGLALMRYRATQIGASIAFTAAEGQSLRVECTLPRRQS